MREQFWNVMFMMFYLNVFYLPTLKQVVGQYKMWNEVKFWFTQMTFYNIYNRLIIRQVNDVEENPGPTIFDIIDPTTTVCADYSQGNELLFGENAGKQCVAMSLSAIIYHHIEDVNLWTSSTLNNILGIGNNLYTSIRYSVQINDYLLLRTVPTFVTAHIFCASRKASIALDARAQGICSLKMTNSTSRPSARLKCKKISFQRNPVNGRT